MNMNLTIRNQQIKMLFKLIKLKKNFNISPNYNSIRCISYSKVLLIKKITNKDLKKVSDFLSGEKNSFENTFGNIENYEIKYEKLMDDPEDIEKYKRQRSSLGKTIPEYIKEIQTHLNNYDYDKAKNVLEIDMVNDEKPTVPYIYRLLISYNGKIGDIKEAYRLYLRYKKRQGKTNGGIITSLFNACANSKNSLVALEKADAIRESLNNDENYTINISNYNAMMKAYGRHGDLQTCLKIVDEVLERKDKVKIESFGFLLQACASDINSGLRHALIVWRSMIQNTLKPRIFEFNVMLRCVRDCFLGEVELLPDFINQIQDKSNQFFRRKVLTKTINNKKKKIILKRNLEENEVLKYFPNIPNEKNILEPESTDPESRNNILTITQSEPLNQGEAIYKNEPDSEIIKEPEMEKENENEKDSEIEILSNRNSNNIIKEPEMEKENENEKDSEIEILSNRNLNNIIKEPEMEKENENEKDSEIEILSNRNSNNSENLSAEIPNLLAIVPSFGSVVSINNLKEPYEKFLLLGGIKGFLKVMSEFKVKPDIKTFTLMLELLPLTTEDEENLIKIMKSYEIKLDTGFFNILIKRRNFRKDIPLVQDSLLLMQKENVAPDIITFGVIALGCDTLESAIELIDSAHNFGYRLNSVILETFLKKALKTKDWNYVKTILKTAKEDEVELSPKFMALLNKEVAREKWQRQMNCEKVSSVAKE